MAKRSLSACLMLPLLALLAAPPGLAAGAQVRVTPTGRLFQGLPAVLMVHGEIPGIYISQIEEPVLTDPPDGGDQIVLTLRTGVRPPGEIATFDRRIEFPKLGSGLSRLVVEGVDAGGFRTEYFNWEFGGEGLPPLSFVASREVLLSTETFTVTGRTEASSGGFHPGWRVEGKKIRLDFGVGCNPCPILMPIFTIEEESDPIGGLEPGEYTLEVWDEPGVDNQLLHRQKIVVLPDPVRLQDGRFLVEVTLDPPHGGKASLVRLPTRDSALFYFFSAANWELMVKVLDGCALNDRFWVFGAASTDVGYTVTVRDTFTVATRVYRHAPGSPAPAITDTAAFACSYELPRGETR